MFLVCGYLVTEADCQLVERYGMRTVSSQVNLQLDGLVHMETGRLELGLALDWSQRGNVRAETFKQSLFLNAEPSFKTRVISHMLEALNV